MANLEPGTTYYVRAYAENSQGVSYGMEVSFITVANPPTVTTGEVSIITQTTALGSGTVTDDGGLEITERGLCWSTSHTPIEQQPCKQWCRYWWLHRGNDGPDFQHNLLC